jgi:hypothetical protein
MDRDAGDLSVRHLAFSGVEPSSDRQAEIVHALDDGASAADGPGRTVE